jgi:hypothetical protein
MNTRERFLAIQDFSQPDRALDWEFGYWGGTILRWYEEGLPRKYGLPRQPQFGETVCGPALLRTPHDFLVDKDVFEVIGFDKAVTSLPVMYWYHPAFEVQVLEEDETSRVIIDEEGIKKRERKDMASLPEHIGGPIAGREDWEKLKEERLNIDRISERFPPDWPQVIQELKNRDYPVGIGGFPVGYFGTLRFLFGEPMVYLAYYDQPDLIRDIQEHLTRLWLAIYEEILAVAEIDFVLFWEDMSYKGGSLISPALVREFMLPHYKKIIDFTKSKGVKHAIVDTDGDCNILIPLFMEAGVTGMYPFEVQAGMDILKVRQEYPTLQIWGGLDKRALALGKAEMDKELLKVPAMLKYGGYIPYLDHIVPPDVPFANYLYFRERLRALIGKQ